MITILLFAIILFGIIMIIGFSCDIRLDVLDLSDLEKDVGYFANRPLIPKQYIQHGGKFVATIFLN